MSDKAPPSLADQVHSLTVQLDGALSMLEAADDELRAHRATIARLTAENERLTKERARVHKFISSDDWAAMNERRADLIGRDARGRLPDREKAELACLQVVAGILVDLAYPRDLERLEEIRDKTLKSDMEMAKRLKAERDRFREQYRTLLNWVTERKITFPAGLVEPEEDTDATH